jgi:hypothetical protein
MQPTDPQSVVVLTLNRWDGKTAPEQVARIVFDYGVDKFEAQQQAEKVALAYVGADARVDRIAPDEDYPHWARSYTRDSWCHVAPARGRALGGPHRRRDELLGGESPAVHLRRLA